MAMLNMEKTMLDKKKDVGVKENKVEKKEVKKVVKKKPFKKVVKKNNSWSSQNKQDYGIISYCGGVIGKRRCEGNSRLKDVQLVGDAVFLFVGSSPTHNSLNILKHLLNCRCFSYAQKLAAKRIKPNLANK